MRKRLLLLGGVVAVAGVLLAWVSVGGRGVTDLASASTRPGVRVGGGTEEDAGVYVWDFRQGLTTGAVKWPAGWEGQDLGYSNTYLWRDDEPAVVQIFGVDGTEATYEVRGRQIYRIGDRVVSATISLPGMTYEQVVLKFREMASTWGITDLREFERWQDRRKPGSHRAGESSCVVRRKGAPTIFLSIRSNYSGRDGLKCSISLSFQILEPRMSSTAPSTP